MLEDTLKQKLKLYRQGKLCLNELIDLLKKIPFIELAHSKIDTHRHIRCGYPEVIFCENKTPAQVKDIARSLYKHYGILFATRATTKHYKAVKQVIKNAIYNKTSRVIKAFKKEVRNKTGKVIIITAGTSDIPVAEEARETLLMLGNKVEYYYDIGVAGIHRLLPIMSNLREANVIIAVAGMEGALPSVVGGLVDKPIIGVPTSVGYGVHFKGFASLLTMLNSCTPNVCVVNIDNGFGAGYLASRINYIAEAKR